MSEDFTRYNIYARKLRAHEHDSECWYYNKEEVDLRIEGLKKQLRVMHMDAYGHKWNE